MISKKRATIEAQSNNHTIKLFEIDSKRFATDSELFIKAQLLVSAYYGFDRPCIDYDFYNIESEALGQEMVYKNGLLPEINFLNPLIAEKKDLYKLKPPVYKDKARFSFVLGINRLFKSILGITPKIRFCGPYSIAVNLRGYKNLMIDMEDDKKFVKDLFDFITYETIIPWVQLQREEMGEPNALAGGIDATATFPNISTRTMNEWIIPYYKQTKQELNNVTFTTCCGGLSSFKDPEDFFFYQLSTCPGIIKGYQWDIKKCGFKVFNNYVKKNEINLRLAISAQTLLEINLNEVLKLVKKYLEEGGVGLTNYSIYLSDIDPNTNPEIVSSIASAVKQLGIFPIKEKIKYTYLLPKYMNLKDWLLTRL
ncbi:MAG: uroporphyrinogen decarboxylase family protein [Actinobacteria bacterium]|nr:uroporphyrinogen decarboxylase family protein [Actinomycetota bacterium]